MKILNLYACLGGNRYKWSDEHQITAVEKDPELARLYKKRFPKDNVIIEDAHQYLLEHFSEYDFIWSSPPCPTHSKIRISQKNRDTFVPVYPDMKLYEEIILLKHYFKGEYCVENVSSYYTPLIAPQKRGRHYYWTNFKLPGKLSNREEISGVIGDSLNEMQKLCEFHNIDLSDYKGEQKKITIARDLVDYEAGKTILNAAQKIYENKNSVQHTLF